MTFHLEQNLNLPLEREHEGWTIRGIEDYAATLGLGLKVCAVSPTEEKVWPADEAMEFRSKFFGLQFKRPYPVGNETRWNIGAASAQHLKICASPEIFYALPSYINRALRLTALHHCLFWRPCDSCCQAPSSPPCISGTTQTRSDLFGCGCVAAMRWGDFVEALYRCELIDPVEPGTDTRQAFEKILSAFREERAKEGIPRPSQEKSSTSLYLIALEVRA